MNEDPYGIPFQMVAGKIRPHVPFWYLERPQGDHTLTLGETVSSLMEVLLLRADEESEGVREARVGDLGEEYNSFHQGEFSEAGLKAALCKVKSGKYPGPDMVPVDVIKNLDKGNLHTLVCC